MKRSEINTLVREASQAFDEHDWALPPNPRWDVTDFGLDDLSEYGLVLVNLAEEPEYCEKIMYMRRNQVTPEHYHASKKEDIICRWGELAVQFSEEKEKVAVKINGEERELSTADLLVLNAGERVTLPPGVKHAFWAASEYAIVGEVSTANDDENDNFFTLEETERFSEIVEDEPPLVELIND